MSGDAAPWLIFPGSPGLMLPAPGGLTPYPDQSACTRPIPRDAGPAVTPELAMAADLCPMGSGPCGCGAEPRLCGHPDRPLQVWRADCLRCRAAAPNPEDEDDR